MKPTCNICGKSITEDEVATVDADGAPAHEWCVEDLKEQDEEAM